MVLANKDDYLDVRQKEWEVYEQTSAVYYDKTFGKVVVKEWCGDVLRAMQALIQKELLANG